MSQSIDFKRIHPKMVFQWFGNYYLIIEVTDSYISCKKGDSRLMFTRTAIEEAVRKDSCHILPLPKMVQGLSVRKRERGDQKLDANGHIVWVHPEREFFTVQCKGGETTYHISEWTPENFEVNFDSPESIIYSPNSKEEESLGE